MEKEIKCFQMPSGQVLIGEVDGDDILFPCWFFQNVNENKQLMHQLVIASFAEGDRVTLNQTKPIFWYNPIKEVKDLYKKIVDTIKKQREEVIPGMVLPGNFKK